MKAGIRRDDLTRWRFRIQPRLCGGADALARDYTRLASIGLGVGWGGHQVKGRDERRRYSPFGAAAANEQSFYMAQQLGGRLRILGQEHIGLCFVVENSETSGK